MSAENSDEEIGPQLFEATLPNPKRVKRLEFEKLFLDALPAATCYELSYMHRDVVTHINVTKTSFIITASQDGHIKFWKKAEVGIEFVKHFKAHLGCIFDVSVSSDGALYSTVGEDKALKIFDIVNFDMINMIKLGYTPQCCEWIFNSNDNIKAIAISDHHLSIINIYDGYGDKVPLHIYDTIHQKPVINISYNPIFEIALSIDTNGMIEYWTGPSKDYRDPLQCPKDNLRFEYKTETDLYDLAKKFASKRKNAGDKIVCSSKVGFSPDGCSFAFVCSLRDLDTEVRLMRFDTGKIRRLYDESKQNPAPPGLASIEMSRRKAVERDLMAPYRATYQDGDKEAEPESKEIENATQPGGTWAPTNNVVFDESGNFILYATLLGIRILNVKTNKCPRLLGIPDNARFLNISLFQGRSSVNKYLETSVAEQVSLEIEAAADNPLLKSKLNDPILFATAFRKNRFYLFSNREPHEDIAKGEERDIFNEKPTKEDMLAVPEMMTSTNLSSSCVIHTTIGDIHCTLFANECPKTIENFCTHSRDGYYNGHIFHRVIKGFMIQTGDPTGTGTGGVSIWGGEFEDEIVPHLKHDKPYMLSMANAGPNTNGSQFFITVVPCSWLDNKHTVFGHVKRGMETVNKINKLATDPDTDKPYDPVSIVSISVK